jgi:beta-galactosidase
MVRMFMVVYDHIVVKSILMIRYMIFCFLLLYSSALFSQAAGTLLFDEGWKFYRGAAQGAEREDYNDTRWRKIDLPHDWSIEDRPGTHSPFSRDAISQVGGGFTTGGTGWYRKSFKVDPRDSGKIFQLLFEGVYMNADVWLNGKHLGNHPYGYTCFFYNISGILKFHGVNVLAVEVKNEGQNSRWYSGSGIYRHVWLRISSLIHLVPEEEYVVTPKVSDTLAGITIRTRVVNESVHSYPVSLQTKIFDDKGIEISQERSVNDVSPGGSYVFDQRLTVKDPLLWSTEKANIYVALVQVYEEGKIVDSERVNFGIRTITFSAANGLLLNGKPLKLKGGCFHNDNGPLGSKSYDRAEERKAELMKASGFNAIRCSHNPPAPAFLDACDRLGMLVIDEAFDAWTEGKMAYDYHLYFNEWWKRDLQGMILRDRNHPSVIMWSIGNEIPERDTKKGASIAKMLAGFVHELDPERVVTAAVNNVNDGTDPYFSALDICGYNYAMGSYEVDHRRLPSRIMMGTESYPLDAFENWMSVIDHPWVIGDFVWTGFDYIGEASIGWRGYPQDNNFYPWILAFCGDIDVCGWKRPQSFYRDVLWKEGQVSVFVKPPKPTFELNPGRMPWSRWHWHDLVSSWNWKGHESELMEVTVYSSCPEAELFLNGHSMGKKPTGRENKFMAIWQVPYQPGTISATGYTAGNQTNTAELHTSTDPERIELVADRIRLKANGEDLSYITINLVDQNGTRNPLAQNLLQFTVTGPGSIAGTGNSNPVSLESFQQPQRKAWQGRCLLIIRSGKKTGNILVKVTSSGLKAGEILLRTN